ncbi:MAG: tetratricopeptide (TPR) repeat protein [Sphingobacteriales bacterium]|jgi:tetratricopeptide (TPR) repeat protein
MKMKDRLQQLLNFLKESPNDSFILFALAQEYWKQNNKEKALEHFETVHKLDENYIGTYYHLGKLYEELEDLEMAKQIFQKGIGIAKNNNNQHALSELQGALMNVDIN